MRLGSILIVNIMLTSIAGMFAVADEAEDSRKDFAKAMSRISIGDSPDEVSKLLGRPDMVHDHDTDSKIEYLDSGQVWYYGTFGPNGFPTLGRVYFSRVPADDFRDSNLTPEPTDLRTTSGPRLVCRIFGGNAMPVDIANLKEAELRRQLALIGEPIECLALYYNPRHTIAAVNALQPLGKETAMAVIDEFLRVCPDEHGSNAEKFMLLLRVLFDVPKAPGHMPTCGLGEPTPAPPTDPKLIPRFPIHVVSDVPLLLVWGYSLEGQPPSANSDLDFFRKHGTIRSKPLIPTKQPLAILKDLETSPQWQYVKREEQERSLLTTQLLRLVDTIYKPNEVASEQDLMEFAYEARSAVAWDRVVEEFQKLNAVWDSRQSEYVKSSNPQNRNTSIAPHYILIGVFAIATLSIAVAVVVTKRSKRRRNRSESKEVK